MRVRELATCRCPLQSDEWVAQRSSPSSLPEQGQPVDIRSNCLDYPKFLIPDSLTRSSANSLGISVTRHRSGTIPFLMASELWERKLLTELKTI